MDGDDRSSGSGGGFDDWLEEEPGPDSDPYAALSEDDPEGEIADWMAFTQGEADADEPEATSVPSEESSDDSDDERDLESDDVASDVESLEADDDADPDDQVIVDLTEDEAPSYVDLDEDDATGELQIVSDETPDAGSEDVEVDAEDSIDAPAESLDSEAPDAEVVELETAATVDAFEFDGGGRADTEELPILAGADVVSASVMNDSAGVDEIAEDTSDTMDTPDPIEDTQPSVLDDPDAIVEMQAIVVDDTVLDDHEDQPEDQPEDDTGELDLFAVPSDADDGDDDDTGELELGEIATAAAVAGLAGAGDDDESAAPFDISQDDYLQTATREHEGLAAAIAEAEDEDTEQVALSAPIPGIEETVIGFDDVVEAEGHGRVRARGTGDLVARVITAVVLIALLGASLLWQPALLALATGVFVIAAGEFYTALAKAGRHPIGLFGFIGIIAASVGAFVWGAIAIPVSFGLVTTALLLYYAVVPGRRDPVGNLALTSTVMVWVGLGTYAMLIAVSDDYRPLVIGVVVLVAAMDIAQYFVGRALGRHQLSPWVSPKKTIEGLVGGVVVALALGALLHFVPPFELTSGLVLGAAVAVLVPLGDLAVSAAKRSLDIKDMGSILPGHGGFLDRIDGLLFVIPAAWAIFLWAGIL